MNSLGRCVASANRLFLVSGTVASLACWAGCAGRPVGSPITVRVGDKEGFATFANRLHPDNRIGYRFHEHTPMVVGDVPRSAKEAGIDAGEVARIEAEYASRPNVTRYTVRVDQKDWVPQDWAFYLAPVEDGIELLLVVQTGKTGLNDYYGIQQCFRMSGRTNEAWRREIAEAPAFSEYDLWEAQSRTGSQRTSLSYVLRSGRWETLPAREASVGARTPLGAQIDDRRAGGQLQSMTAIGPYKAEVLPPIDCGLITRADAQRTWVCGIFWEHTSHVTDHHPADCLHSIVNIGGIPPNSKRALRGKIYWFKGTLDDLANRWRRDFPKAQ